MQVLRTLIVDDEPYAHELMKKYVSMTPGLELAGACWDVIEAYKLLHKEHIDLMLLDVKMPEISGIDFLKKLKDPPMVIFTTAYSEYALESYELNAIDYLLKPFSYERFLKAIQKIQQTGQSSAPKLIEVPEPATRVPVVPQPAMEDILFVRSEGKLIKIELGKLIYIESLKDYLRLFVGEERIVIHGTMKNMEVQLKEIPAFLRVNKSYIVNIQYITQVEGNMIKLGDATIPIGKTYREKVHSLLNSFKLM